MVEAVQTDYGDIQAAARGGVETGFEEEVVDVAEKNYIDTSVAQKVKKVDS